MEKLIAEIKAIAEENPDGFTILLPTLEHAKKGWVVALAETQDSFGDAGLRVVIEVAQRLDTAIGGWEHKGKFYYDAVLLLDDKDEAIRVGKQNRQIGIFNIETVTYIEL